MAVHLQAFFSARRISAGRFSVNTTKMRNAAFALYAQDEIKVNTRLTADVGVRWDVMVPFSEVHNNIVYLNCQDPPSLIRALEIFLGGASEFGNCDVCAGVTRAAIHWKNFQPRVGLSYQLNSKTVLQAGFFMTYLNSGTYELAACRLPITLGPVGQ